MDQPRKWTGHLDDLLWRVEKIDSILRFPDGLGKEEAFDKRDRFF